MPLLFVTIAVFIYGGSSSTRAFQGCTQICNELIDCSTPCWADLDPGYGYETTCGDFDGGAAHNWCYDGSPSYCGDGVCDIWQGAETCNSCSQDCGGCEAEIRYPNDGYAWWLVTSPVGAAVGDCFGNCGAGCSDAVNPCGGPGQYWELEQLSEWTSPTTETFYECVGSYWWYRVTADVRYAQIRWTYHGWVKPGCISHDYYCNQWLVGCVLWAGCGDPGWEDTWPYEYPLRVVEMEHGRELVSPEPQFCVYW